VKKDITAIVFENWVENSPIQKVEEIGEKGSVVSTATLGSTVRIQEIKFAWALRARENGE
jgi:hypothetical protein